MLIFLMEFLVNLRNDEAEADSGLNPFRIVMDMQQESCMMKKFHMEEFCKDSDRRTKL
jgi:hypothetical protein